MWRSTRSCASSLNAPVGSPSASRTMRPLGGSGVVAVDAGRAHRGGVGPAGVAVVAVHPGGPVRHDRGRAAPAVGRPPGNGAYSQPRPRTHGASGVRLPRAPGRRPGSPRPSGAGRAGPGSSTARRSGRGCGRRRSPAARGRPARPRPRRPGRSSAAPAHGGDPPVPDAHGVRPVGAEDAPVDDRQLVGHVARSYAPHARRGPFDRLRAGARLAATPDWRFPCPPSTTSSPCSSTSCSRSSRTSRPPSATIATTTSWPDMSEAGHTARVAFIDRWEGDAGRARCGVARRRRADRPRPGPGRARVVPLRRDGAARGDVEPAALGLPGRRRAAPAARPRLRAARRPARVRRGPARGDPAAARPGARRSSARTRRGRSRSSTPRSPRSASAAWRRSRGTPSRPREAAADRPRRGGAPARACAPPPTRPPRRSRRWPSTSPTRSSRTSSGPAELGEPLFAGQAPPHAPRPGRDGRRPSSPGPRRSTPPSAAEMVRIAREIWPAWRPGEPVPDDDGALVRGHARRHRRRPPRGADDLLEFCRDELARIEAFCRERDVIGLVDEPLEIDWTPEFLRSFGGAMLDSPGPARRRPEDVLLDHAGPRRVDADEGESYLREDNARQLRLLTIHEAVPGHYLQMVYANRGSSLARRVFRSGLFAEGWAVYVTQVMLDRGYGGGRPRAVARPLEVLPAGGRQHDHRRPDPHDGHDVRGGDRPHGRRRLPGAGRGPRQGRAGAADRPPSS